MKRFLPLLLISLLLLTLIPSTTLAAGPFTLTINSAQPLDGRTFEVYQLLDATDLGSGSVHYTVVSAWADFFATKFSLNKADSDFDAKVAAAINALSGATALQGLAADAYAAKGAIAPTATISGKTGLTTTVSVPGGYYLIRETTSGSPVAYSLLTVIDGNKTIYLKSDQPDITKEISGPFTGNTVQVGDIVTYIVRGVVPNTDAYTSYIYKINDTLTGLTFQSITSVTVGGTLVTAADYTLDTNVAPKSFTLQLNNIKSYTPGDAIVVTYTAKVNDTAAAITVAENEANLTFSNNPGSGGIGDGPDHNTYSHMFALTVNKVGPDGTTALDGATFKISTTNGLAGPFIKMADGSTDVTISPTGSGATATATFRGLKAGQQYYLVETAAPPGYSLPTTDWPFNISATLSADGSTVDTWSLVSTTHDGFTPVGPNTDVHDLTFGITIANTTGGALPETGGMGTVALYVGGGLLLLAGLALILFMRKRAKG